MAAVAVCGGCAELAVITSKAAYYSDAPEQELAMPDGRYRIRDKANEGSLLISWTLGTTTREIKVFGTQEERAPRARFQRAAEQFLRESGRNCEIHHGTILAAPHWEFTYACRPRD
jgi:hypothetical protein